MGACNSVPRETDELEFWKNMCYLTTLVKEITPDDTDTATALTIKLMVLEHKMLMRYSELMQCIEDMEKLKIDPSYKTNDMIREEFGKKYGNIQLVHTDTAEYMATNPEVLHYAVKDGDGNPITLDCPTLEEYQYFPRACSDYANTSIGILTNVVKMVPKPAEDYKWPSSGAAKGIVRVEITRNKSAHANIGLNNKANVRVVIDAPAE
jgi:hypothetical protein